MEAHSASLDSVHPATRPPASVLVVDDDEHVRRALRRVLKRSGCAVLDAADAEAALALLEQERVHVVVSDYRMPGMSGVELLRAVKERWPRVQRVLLTGQADTTAIEEAVNRSEIFRFIWKPWDDAHLLLTLQSAIDQYWLTEENAQLSDLLTQRNVELELANADLEAKVEQRSIALVRAAEEWRACFDAIGDPLAILRSDGAVVRANTAFAARAGVELGALPGLWPRDGGFGELPFELEAGETGVRATREVVRDDRTWLLRSYPASDGGSVVLWKDVTEEHDVTRRLHQAEKMAAVGQLAGGVAHEINNPLGGILAFAQLMLQDERDESDRESLKLIQDAAVRAKRIVESLLRFSRRPKGDERSEVDLARLAEDALFLLSAQLKDGRVEVVRDLQPAPVVANGNQLQQILVNLIVNARQAVGATGKITVHTGIDAPGVARMSVSDDGPGVPPALVGRLFEPFFTTKPEGQGTGLGLSICYRIAEEHGGNIRYESASGGGACFVVELPAPSSAA